MWVDLDNCWQMHIKATPARNNCKECRHAAPQAFLAQSKGGLAGKSDGFIHTPASGVNNNCFMQNRLSTKLFSCLWNRWSITKRSSGADAFYFSEDIYIYFWWFTVLTSSPQQHLPEITLTAVSLPCCVLPFLLKSRVTAGSIGWWHWANHESGVKMCLCTSKQPSGMPSGAAVKQKWARCAFTEGEPLLILSFNAKVRCWLSSVPRSF